MKDDRQVLIVTAVEAEREAVLRGIGAAGARFTVLAGGVGPAAAAASTAAALARGSYDLVVSAGIAGGFPGQAEVGSLVLASSIIAADLGAETEVGFMSVDELGFGSCVMEPHMPIVQKLSVAGQQAGYRVKVGAIITVTTVTGSAATASLLAERVPGAAAEAMEGFGAATAAQQLGIPFLEMRAISNEVGPRNREAWRIGDALRMLENAASLLPEVLL